MKNIWKSILFVVIFGILFHFVTNIFVLKGDSYGSDIISFYEEKQNSLDVIFFGSSHSFAAFSPDIIKEKTGYNSYNFATGQQPVHISYFLMKEALKYQKPQYFVLDVYMFLDSNFEIINEAILRKALDKMRFSSNKIAAIETSVSNPAERMAYYFNIIKYHTRYSELTWDDVKRGILNKGLDNKGYKALEPKNEIMVDNKDLIKDQKRTPLNPMTAEYFQKIIDLCQENDIELILVKTPSQLYDNDEQYYNEAFAIAEENGYTYINYNQLFKELGITNGDFYDYGHLAKNGSIKVSNHFSDYLNELKGKNK